MLDSPMSVNQNIVCGSKTDQRDHFPKIHLDASLFSGIHWICISTFPFDPPTQSDTFSSCNIGTSALPDIETLDGFDCGNEF